jgi:hypothetical protein
MRQLGRLTMYGRSRACARATSRHSRPTVPSPAGPVAEQRLAGIARAAASARDAYRV